MKLQEIFDHLSASVLTQISIGGQTQGVVNSENRQRVTGMITQGLTDLHTRFLLKEKFCRLLLSPTTSIYQLNAKFAQSNADSGELTKYIDDSEMPFLDDITRVHSVTTDGGFELFTSPAAKYKVRLVSQTSVQVPQAILTQSNDLPPVYKTEGLVVTYCANHPAVGKTALSLMDPDTVDIDLPVQYLQALLYYVGHMAYTPIGQMAENSLGLSYSIKYEQECLRLKNGGVEIQASKEYDRMRDKGWP